MRKMRKGEISGLRICGCGLRSSNPADFRKPCPACTQEWAREEWGAMRLRYVLADFRHTFARIDSLFNPFNVRGWWME